MRTLRGAAALAASAALAGCGTATVETERPLSEGDTVPAVLASVCAAAAADDAATAEDAFHRAHDGIHTLARDLQAEDRRDRAATLLEAKQRVEAGFAEAAPPADLTGRLVTLSEAVAAGVAPEGEPIPTCPEETSS